MIKNYRSELPAERSPPRDGKGFGVRSTTEEDNLTESGKAGTLFLARGYGGKGVPLL